MVLYPILLSQTWSTTVPNFMLVSGIAQSGQNLALSRLATWKQCFGGVKFILTIFVEGCQWNILKTSVWLKFVIGVGSKTCVKRPLSKRQKIGFQDQLWLNAGQKYCRMLQAEHSAIPIPIFIQHKTLHIMFIALVHINCERQC